MHVAISPSPRGQGADAPAGEKRRFGFSFIGPAGSRRLGRGLLSTEPQVSSCAPPSPDAGASQGLNAWKQQRASVVNKDYNAAKGTGVMYVPSHDKAAEYRRLAEEARTMARQISIQDGRAKLLEAARHFETLADLEERGVRQTVPVQGSKRERPSAERHSINAD